MWRRCSSAYVGGSTPCTGPFCSAYPVVGVVVHTGAWEWEERSDSAVAEWANRGRNIRLSIETYHTSTCHFLPLRARSTWRGGEKQQQQPGPVCSSSRLWETPKRGRLSWHELTYQTDMETKPFLSLGQFVCLITSSVFDGVKRVLGQFFFFFCGASFSMLTEASCQMFSTCLERLTSFTEYCFHFFILFN